MICYKQTVFLSFVDDRLRTVLDDRAHVIHVLLIRKIRGRFFQYNVIVNIAFFLAASRAFLLDFSDVPGATPKNPASGLMA